MVSLIRATIFFINRKHQLNFAYLNYLQVILTATETSTGLMCACLPLTKPLAIHFATWLRKIRGLNANHQGWTTISASAKKAEQNKDLKITRVVDYNIQMLPIAKITNVQPNPQNQGLMVVERPWQSIGPYDTTAYCESVVSQAPCTSHLSPCQCANANCC
jgi:hypothetical protein